VIAWGTAVIMIILTGALIYNSIAA
jgi:hypothetical protein